MIQREAKMTRKKRRKTRSGSRLLLIPPNSRHHHCVLTQRAALSPPLIGKQVLCHSAQHLLLPPSAPAKISVLAPFWRVGDRQRTLCLVVCLGGCRLGVTIGGVTNAGKRSFVSWQSVCNLCQWGSFGLG